ncbi:hypothetical protein C7S16_0289 [Burkholderia thailandensis]|uniref:Uncharacterized protein n=1 Tax=Burkholderia thailandensis TaxID=57975 RepID=A0AAW9CTZ0_BURTH|nr:hypothetical protein [Burkholderia thailandensis]MDW9254318.1 hypothetical protein [Burkholderia thailandensis]
MRGGRKNSVHSKRRARTLRLPGRRERMLAIDAGRACSRVARASCAAGER